VNKGSKMAERPPINFDFDISVSADKKSVHEQDEGCQAHQKLQR